MKKVKKIISEILQIRLPNFVLGRSVTRGSLKYVLVLCSLSMLFTTTLNGQGFITTWQTTTASESITIPTKSGVASWNYAFTIDWGDGTTDNTVYDDDATHTYTTPGTYTVELSGSFPSLYFNNQGDTSKIQTIEQWGNIQWESMGDAFYGCSNLTSNASDVPDLSQVASLNNMFNGASSFSADLSAWDVSTITGMTQTFGEASSFNGDVSTWDVSNVTIMSYMFNGASSFNQDLSGWDVSGVAKIDKMFRNASAFNSDISGWNVSNVIDLSGLFVGAASFNQDIGSWDVTGKADMSLLFASATAFNQDLSGWDVSGVTKMNSMFTSAQAFDQNIGSWNVSAVTNMYAMFWNTPLNQDLSGWNVSNVTTMNQMFGNATAFDQSLATWDVSSVIDMTSMLINTALSTTNYDATLIAWASLPNLQTAVPLGANGLIYCDAIAARNTLTSTNGWIISGDEECPPQGFITTWQTTAASESITIPTKSTVPSWNYAFTVDWGDGTTDNTVYDTDATHTYASPGNYTVELNGSFPSLYFNNQGDTSKIQTVEQWGNIQWLSMENAFYGCSNLNSNATDVPDLSQVGALDNMFNGATSFNANLSEWDVSAVTGMTSVFYEASSFNGDISTWDVSNVVVMSSMFYRASSFNQDISGWDVSSAAKMDKMFFYARPFNSDISGWDVSNVIEMSGMFLGATSFNQDIGNWDMTGKLNLSQLFVGAIAFNQDLSSWDVSGVTNMNSMFTNAAAFNQDIGGWDVSSVTNMYGLFWHTPLNHDLSSWDVSNVTTMSHMFGNAQSFDQSLATWDVSNVTTMTNMLLNTPLSITNYDATLIAWANLPSLQSAVSLMADGLVYCDAVAARDNLISNNGWTISGDQECPSEGFVTTWQTTAANESITIPTKSAVASWNYAFTVDWGDGTTDNTVYDTDATHTYASPGTYTVELDGSFASLYFNNQGDTSKIQTIEQWGNIKWESMGNAFNGCSNLTSNATDVPDLSQVESLSYMFDGASSFNADLSGWDVGTITGMTKTFGDASSFNGDISSWDVSNAVIMSFMFDGASSFNQDLSGWDVSSVAKTDKMFRNATAFNSDISGWDVSNVIDLSAMFVGAASFNQDIGNWDVTGKADMSLLFANATAFNQDISAWDVSAVTNMSAMFNGAQAFNQDIGGWDVSSVTNMNQMFWNTPFNHDVSGWKVSNVTDMNQMFGHATAFDQSLASWDVSNVTNMTTMLLNTALSTANYDATLIAWASLPNLQSAVPLGANGLVYCDAVVARNMLISNNGWIITGDEQCPSQGFVTTWQTTAANESITIPTKSAVASWNYAFTIDWGDGTTDNTVYDTDATHTYASPGTYTVELDGSFASLYFNNQGDTSKIQTIEQWGNIQWESMGNAFNGCSNLTSNATDVPDLSQVESLSYMFDGASSFNADLSGWDVGTITGMTKTFGDASSFNGDISSWDVSNAVIMSFMFDGASSFNQDLSGWDVSSVAKTDKMFRNATAFNSDISAWNVSNVIDLSAMFVGAASFNQDVGSWDVTSKADMSLLFANATAFNQDLSAWDVSAVTNMSGMFNGAQAFNQDIGGWDVSSVTNMNQMFWNTPFNHDVSGWKVSNVTNMNQMFGNASAFNQGLGAWDINSVADMTSMLDNTALSTANYDATLTGWANVSGLQPNVTLGANGLLYCTSVSNRADLISNLGWSISGDALANCSQITVLDFEQREILDGQTNAISFGITSEGVDVDKEFIIQNNGFSPLTIEEVVLTGAGFSLIGDAPSVVEAEGSASFAVRMSGAIEGSLEMTITVTSDNLDIAEYNFTVTGEVVRVLGTKQAMDMSIYPNPVSRELHISFNDKQLLNSTVSIQTLSGKELIKIGKREMKRELVIPISHLQNGVFLLQINSGDQTTTHRFVKN